MKMRLRLFFGFITMLFPLAIVGKPSVFAEEQTAAYNLQTEEQAPTYNLQTGEQGEGLPAGVIHNPGVYWDEAVMERQVKTYALIADEAHLIYTCVFHTEDPDAVLEASFYSVNGTGERTIVTQISTDRTDMFSEFLSFYDNYEIDVMMTKGSGEYSITLICDEEPVPAAGTEPMTGHFGNRYRIPRFRYTPEESGYYCLKTEPADAFDLIVWDEESRIESGSTRESEQPFCTGDSFVKDGILYLSAEAGKPCRIAAVSRGYEGEFTIEAIRVGDEEAMLARIESASEGTTVPAEDESWITSGEYTVYPPGEYHVGEYLPEGEYVIVPLSGYEIQQYQLSVFNGKIWTTEGSDPMRGQSVIKVLPEGAVLILEGAAAVPLEQMPPAGPVRAGRECPIAPEGAYLAVIDHLYDYFFLYSHRNIEIPYLRYQLLERPDLELFFWNLAEGDYFLFDGAIHVSEP